MSVYSVQSNGQGARRFPFSLFFVMVMRREKGMCGGVQWRNRENRVFGTFNPLTKIDIIYTQLLQEEEIFPMMPRSVAS